LLHDGTNAALAGAVSELAAVTLMELGRPDPLPDRWWARLPLHDDVVWVVHTSGTSGAPKPVPYTNLVAASRARVLGDLWGVAGGSVFASGSGFHHVAGFAAGLSVLAGGGAVAPVERFTVEIWASLAELGVTHAVLVPTMIDRLLDEKLLLIPGLRLLQYGAAPMPPPLLARLLDRAPELELLQLYGQTEGTPLTALTPADHRMAGADVLATVGRPVGGVELRLESVDSGGRGEVVVRGAHIAQPGPDGWLHTGDIGELGRAGYLRLHGRTKDRIVRGGENIDPVEVEEVLITHPQVADVAVAGVPDEHWGQAVHAWIVPLEDLSQLGNRAQLDTEALRTYARKSLSGFKVPTSWHLVSDLPRNPSGKVLRRYLVQSVTPD
jgi:acyl-CoA synthetase (AMP-forming)/AMP-acid ligase II